MAELDGKKTVFDFGIIIGPQLWEVNDGCPTETKKDDWKR